MLDMAVLAQAVPQQGGFMDTLILIVPMILIFYFLIIRPQNKRMKQHRAMVENIQRGDTVVTAGGLVGKVVKVKDEEEAEIELAEGVRVRVVKRTIADVRTKTKPVKEEK